MSDVGKLKRAGVRKFPSVRKTADPMQPELGELDFAEDMVQFEQETARQVSGTSQTDEAVINEEERRKQYRMRKKKDEKEESKSPLQTEEMEGPDFISDETSFIDVTA